MQLCLGHPGKSQIFGGLLLVSLGTYWYWSQTPAIVLGGGQDLGHINGDDPPLVKIGFINLHPGSIYLKSAKVGCSADPVDTEARPFVPVWFDCPLILSGVPSGHRQLPLTVRGFRGKEVISVPTYLEGEVYRNVQ